MKNAAIIKTLERMDHLIRRRSTGNPVDFAAKLSVSERSLYNYLSLLKELGAPLCYSRILESYIYIEEGHMGFEFQKKKDSEYAF